MSPRHLAVLALALAGVAWAADAPAAPTLGAAWFARLRDPQTRMAALYQHERAAAGEDEEIADPEAFAARHHGTLVFPCPQPRHPGAWAVVSPQVWREGRDLLVGADPQSYPPHPLESERRRAWDAALAKLPPDFKPWQAGQPWFESLSGFLVDASGKELETFYAGPAIIADFDADGMLDLMKIERLHVQRAAKAPDAYIDCISIGPLASTRPRKAMLYCNLRDESSWAARAWRFTVRANPPAALQLVLVPTANDRQEITYQFRKGRFVASLAKLPQDILENTRPGTDECEASAKFLKKHGLAFVGVGGDHPAELDANLPNPVPAGPLTWSLPDTSALAPRAAALAMVSHQLNASFEKYYELASLGEPVPPATRGWLERCEGGGFGGELHTMVWWFVGDSAQQWSQRDSTTFLISDVSPAELGRRIAITHELDRVRAVPKTPNPPECDHSRGGGDDMWFSRVRALTTSPEPLATVFDASYPSLWHQVGLKVDRDLASVVAALYVDPAQTPGKLQSIRGIAPLWLDPQNTAKIPAPLICAALRAIGENHWTEMRPQLEKFQLALGPLSKAEQRLSDIARLNAGYSARCAKLQGRDAWLAERDMHALEREGQALLVDMTGELGFELRTQVQKSLAELAK